MKITSISAQVNNKNRVNVSVDGRYRFSLDVYQLADLGVRVGKDYSDEELVELEKASQFGKLYSRALEYCLMRPHSSREVLDYLRRKTRPTRTKTGELRPGYDVGLVDLVHQRLVDKGYVDDAKFARYWVDNRHQAKGVSRRKLVAELRAKGVESAIIEAATADSNRSDDDEIKKVIAKKRGRYADEQKLIVYLMRQGFSYDDVRQALEEG